MSSKSSTSSDDSFKIPIPSEPINVPSSTYPANRPSTSSNTDTNRPSTSSNSNDRPSTSSNSNLPPTSSYSIMPPASSYSTTAPSSRDYYMEQIQQMREDVERQRRRLAEQQVKKSLPERLLENIKLKFDPEYRDAKKAEAQAKKAEQTALRRWEKRSMENMRRAAIEARSMPNMRAAYQR